jgi:hypothetical protein
MLRKLIFALACVIVPMFVTSTPAAAQDMHYRQVSQRCHAPMCMRYTEDGVSTIYFVVQHQTYGQNLLACEHAYVPCRVVRRALQEGVLPTAGALLPPLTPSPTTPSDDVNKDEVAPPETEGVIQGDGVARDYQVAPGVLQRQVQ